DLRWRVVLGDPGDHRALLLAERDRELQELLRLRQGLGGDHLPHAQLDLAELVDLDARRRVRRGGGGGRRRRFLVVDAREEARELLNRRPGGEAAPDCVGELRLAGLAERGTEL